MLDRIVSTVCAAPTPLLVYSALSAYGSRRGGELPGTWFVEALAALRQEPASVRQTLFRMVRERELDARKLGRVKYFRLSAFGSAAVEAGAHKLFDRPEGAWDGEWTLVQYSFPTRARVARDRVRDLLETEGFAALGRGLYIHPRDRTARILTAAAESGDTRGVIVLRARRAGGEDDRELVARLWDLRSIDRAYSRFVERFTPLARSGKPPREPRDAFVLRFAVAIAFLEIAWDDPELPDNLLPPDWSGPRARALALSLYERLLPGTLAYGDAVLANVEHPLDASAIRRA